MKLQIVNDEGEILHEVEHLEEYAWDNALGRAALVDEIRTVADAEYRKSQPRAYETCGDYRAAVRRAKALGLDY